MTAALVVKCTVMSKLSQLFVVAAPSGGGKTSLLRHLLDHTDDIALSISHTTRPMRPGEEEGAHYHFVNSDTFLQMIEEQQFFEYATVHGNYYGTSKAAIQNQLDDGIDVVLEIDWQGARQMKALFPRVVTVFILPPSFAVLEQRLHDRQQDSEAVIAARLDAARDEIRHVEEFDYWIVNDNFELAASHLHAIVEAERLRQPIQQARHQHLLAKLLKTQ